jgi:hypothetical protein
MSFLLVEETGDNHRSASSTTKASRHDIAEILLKVVLNTKIQIPLENWISNDNTWIDR